MENEQGEGIFAEHSDNIYYYKPLKTKEDFKQLVDLFMNYNPYPRTVYFGRYACTVDNGKEEWEAISEMFNQSMKDYEEGR